MTQTGQVQELIEYAMKALRDDGRTEDYILQLSYTWNALTRYLKRTSTRFSAEAGANFLKYEYGIETGDRYEKLRSIDKRRRRAINILVNCLEHCTVTVPKTYLPYKFPLCYEHEFMSLLEQRRSSNLAISTVTRDIRCLNKLSEYLEISGVVTLRELNSSYIIGFMKWLSTSGQLPTLKGSASTLFILQQGCSEPVLTKELSDAWCQKRPYEKRRNETSQRVTCLRQFALYLVSTGRNAYIPVHIKDKPSRKSKYVAYIFTHEEMERIIACSDKVYPNRRSTMHLVMPVLVRLLYSTGMRIMEALTLQLKNVDLVNGVLRIEHAKFDKDRLLPLSPSLFQILKEYCAVMHPQYLPEDCLFVGITRRSYSHHDIYLRFRELLQQAEIPHAGRGNGPRIHDIRYPNLNKIQTISRKASILPLSC